MMYFDTTETQNKKYIDIKFKVCKGGNLKICPMEYIEFHS